jgi:hypothetical protein
MPKRKEPELDPKEQYKRFKEAAQEAGVTEDERAFEKAFTTVVRSPARKKQPSRTKVRKSLT